MRKVQSRFQRISPMIFAGLFALFGLLLLVISHASSPYSTSEAEGGSLAGGATAITDTNASGGLAVRFGSGVSYAVPNSIPADCSVEVSAQLNNFINTVPDGTAGAPNTINFPTNACYWVDNPVVIGGNLVVNHSNSPQNGRHFLNIEGNNATLKAKTLEPNGAIKRDELAVVYGSNIYIHNINAVGLNTIPTYNPAYEHDGNFGVAGSNYVTFDDVHGSDAYGDCMDTGPAEFIWPDSEMVQNFTFKNSTCNVTGRMGIDCTGCNGFAVDHNTFNNIGYTAFDLEVEDNTWTGNNVSFTNNTVGQVHFDVVANGGGSHMVSNVTITGNVETLPSVTCWESVYLDWTSTDPVHRPGPYLIANNSFQGPGDMVWINRVDNVTITNNTKPAPGCRNAGVVALSSVGDTVTGNDFSGMGAAFVNFDGADTNYTVCGNRLSAGGAFDQPTTCQ